MTLDGVGGWGGAWLIAALLLGIAELVVPGVFLIFLALAAGITGAMVLAVPALPPVVQLIAFTLWSVLAVAIGRRWYHDYPVASADTLLNDRGARLAGQHGTIATAIEGGRGRVRVGDGEWPAAGPDSPIGTRVRITRVEDGVLLVEAEPATLS